MNKCTIIAGGDIFPREATGQFSDEDAAKLFQEEIITLFHQADYSVCNLEGALTNSETLISKCGPNLKAPPESIRSMKALGIKCFSLANNHVTDYGKDGYQETCNCLEANHIDYFGAGKATTDVSTHITKDIKGIKVTIYSTAEKFFNIPDEDCPGVNLYDEYTVCKEIRQLRDQCDCLIVLYHGGAEYFPYPTKRMRQQFHRMADSGADIIINQHTHCIGTMEEYKGAFLLYGQGNFHFVQRNEPELTKEGLLLEIDVYDQGKGYQIRYHRIIREGNFLKYKGQEGLEAFSERNERLKNGDSFDREFTQYSRKWTLKWLEDFRGASLKGKMMKKVLSKEKYNQYLMNSYSRNNVARMLACIRGEEYAEIMQRGLESYLNEK